MGILDDQLLSLELFRYNIYTTKKGWMVVMWLQYKSLEILHLLNPNLDDTTFMVGKLYLTLDRITIHMMMLTPEPSKWIIEQAWVAWVNKSAGATTSTTSLIKTPIIIDYWFHISSE